MCEVGVPLDPLSFRHEKGLTRIIRREIRLPVDMDDDKNHSDAPLPTEETSAKGTRDWPHAPPHRLSEAGI